MTELPFIIFRVSENPDPSSGSIGSAEDYCGVLASHDTVAVCQDDNDIGLDDIPDEAKAFRDDVQGSIAIVVEYTSPASGSTLSYLCAQLRAITQLTNVAQLIVSVPSVSVLQETGMLGHVYSDSIPTILIVDEASGFFLLADGTLRTVDKAVARSRKLSIPNERVNVEDLHLRFGHFSTQLEGITFHANCIPNVDAITGSGAAWQRLVASTKDDVSSVCDGADFVLLPIEWSGGELERLGLEICGGHVDRLYSPREELRLNAGVCVTLSITPLSADSHRQIAFRRGVPRDLSLRHVNLIGKGNDVTAVVEVPDLASTFPKWSCPYCEQNVPDEGGGSKELMGPLHPKLFWDILGWDESHVQIRHWPSPTTPNHFNLKIESEPIFRVFGHTLAERMINVIQARGILPNWIDAIISTAGYEARGLVPHLAACLGIKNEKQVQVDTDIRELADRPGVDDDLRKWVKEMEDNGKDLSRSNVLLVDQAAHHLRTLSQLRKVAKVFGARPLAFTVFVDRTGYASDQSLGSLYYGLHFVPLYSWDCPPWRAFECPCNKQVELRR